MSNSVEPQVAKLNIGELLSSKRHQLHESITDVSNKIKLSKAVVEKLEANQFNDIGTAVYVRGYLGLYAKHLGLDGSAIIEQYNTQYPAEDVVIRPSVGQGLSETRQTSKRHSKTLSFLMVAMVMGGLAFAYMQAENYWQEKTTDDIVDANTATQSNPEGGITTALNEATAAQNLADDVLSGESIGNTNGALVTNIELDIALSDAAKQAEKELLAKKQAETEQTPENTEGENVDSPKNSVAPKVDIQLESIDLNETEDSPVASDATTTTNTTTETAEEPAVTAPGTTTINMTFKAECWVKITDADKKVVVAKLYQAGDSLNVSGKAPLTVSTGAPFAVSSVMLNRVAVNLADYKIRGIRYRLPKQ